MDQRRRQSAMALGEITALMLVFLMICYWLVALRVVETFGRWARQVRGLQVNPRGISVWETRRQTNRDGRKDEETI